MFEHFSPDALTVMIRAREQAHSFGHPFICPEHLLLAVAAAAAPAGRVLREQGITPRRVEAEIVRIAGPRPAADLFGDLDRDVLSAIGVDLDSVRARVEESFGPEALARAAFAAHPRARLSRLNPARAISPALLRRLRRQPVRLALPADPAPGHRQAAGPEAVPDGLVPLAPRARRTLEHSIREAQARTGQQVGVEHLALGLLETKGGLVPPVLLALGPSGPALRAAILNRYRQAS